MVSFYLWIKALHILAVISWMAGLLYLPRLFVYHVGSPTSSEQAQTFAVMEQRLFRIIMMPALLVTWASGGTLVWILGEEGVSVFGWFWVKIVAVLAMTALHFRLGWHIRQFKSGANTFSMRYFRIINEVPALLAVVAVVMVVLKPF